MRIYGPENFWLHYLTSNNHQDLEFIFGNKVTDGFGIAEMEGETFQKVLLLLDGLVGVIQF